MEQVSPVVPPRCVTATVPPPTALLPTLIELLTIVGRHAVLLTRAVDMKSRNVVDSACL